MSKLNISETAAWFKERDNFIIITHNRPDGDTLCSAAALARGLNIMGKNAYLVFNPQTTEKFMGFMGQYFAPVGYEHDHVISVDTASTTMFPESAESLVDAVDVCIDHHMSNSGYAKNTLCIPEYAACGEIIYELLMELLGGIDEETAKLLYIAVSTDTGCFVYANTNEHTLRTASLLVKSGADNGGLNKVLFRTKRKARIALEGMLFNDIKYYKDGEIAVMAITLDMLKQCGAVEDDLEDSASIPGQIEGVVAGVMIRQLEENKCKVSVRTTPMVDANKACSILGGGGHNMAAGCTLDKPIDQTRELVVQALNTIWPEE